MFYLFLIEWYGLYIYEVIQCKMLREGWCVIFSVIVIQNFRLLLFEY